MDAVPPNQTRRSPKRLPVIKKPTLFAYLLFSLHIFLKHEISALLVFLSQGQFECFCVRDRWSLFFGAYDQKRLCLHCEDDVVLFILFKAIYSFFYLPLCVKL